MGFRKIKSAFTVIEMVICLVVLAVILTAAAVAFDACIKNYEANKNLAETVIKANQALSRIIADLRTASSVQLTEPNSQCSLFTADGSNITYLFKESEKKLYLKNNATDTEYLLCEDIASATFDRTAGTDANGVPCVKSVQVKITVRSGNYTRDACAAAVIRKNLTN